MPDQFTDLECFLHANKYYDVNRTSEWCIEIKEVIDWIESKRLQYRIQAIHIHKPYSVCESCPNYDIDLSIDPCRSCTKTKRSRVYI